jgi:putative ABC transport system permease protein
VNLALRDIRHDAGRFTLTTIGLGLLLTVVLAMTGIYNGIIVDAVALPASLKADLWIVQRDTRGPFAELSKIPAELEDRALAVPGVGRARTYVAQTIQRELPDGRPLRCTAVGLAWPGDRGQGIPLIAGRPIGQAHYEVIVDESLGLRLGERFPLGRDSYTVVGITRGVLASAGDAVAFFTRADAQQIQNDSSNEAIRLDREARTERIRRSWLGNDPELVRFAGESAGPIPAIAPPSVSAVMVNLAPGASLEAVKGRIAQWKDISVYTNAQQDQLILGGIVEKTRKQIGLFRGLLVVISTLLMSLILYNMTVDKLHSIALLKLLGARTSLILGMILQEALLLGVSAYLIAVVVGSVAFERFPRRVIVNDGHRLMLAVLVVVISVIASVFGMRKALAADPNEVLAG